METQWTSLLAGLTLVCTLFAPHSALPTDLVNDVAVRLRHSNTADAHVTVGPPPSNPQQTGAEPGLPAPNAAILETAPGSVVPPPNSPFTNHFVLDTANLDLNGDGCIAGGPELDLFKYHVATALSGSRNNLLRAHSIVHRTDTNKDGRICWCDFISIYLHDREESDEHHHSAPFVVILDRDSGMFSKLDQDKDGLLKGAELDLLAQQFAYCIAEDQARLIVAAMTGLGVKDGAISSTEFARFLGMNDPPQKAASAIGKISASPAQTVAGNEQQRSQTQHSEMSGTLATTALPESSRAAMETKMAVPNNETPKLQA